MGPIIPVPEPVPVPEPDSPFSCALIELRR